MKSRVLSLWRGLPTPIRRAAHLTVGAPRALWLAVEANQARAAAARAEREALAAAFKRARRGNLPARAPITIVGFHGAVHGLGEGARMLARGFADIDAPVRALDLSPDFGFAPELAPAFPPPRDDDRGVVISHINPPELLRWARETGGRPLEGRRHVGYWAWELETPPPDWAPAFALVDEVWTPSVFAADAIRKIAPRRVKVTPVPYPLYLNPRPQPDRARFGLPEDKTVVLMAFDLRSTAQRKNPYAGLAAFRRANAAGNAILVCKVVGADICPEPFAALAAAVASDDTIWIMTQSVSAADMATLTASVDIVLSLHRSEGFGLLLAEAIWLGKPALATGWSANVEYMGDGAGLLVDYTLVPVQDDGAIYRAGRWAEADVDDAARKLATLITDGAARDAAARAAAARHVAFDRAAWTAMIRERLPLA